MIEIIHVNRVIPRIQASFIFKSLSKLKLSLSNLLPPVKQKV